MWAAIHYDLNNNIRLNTVSRLEQWNSQLSLAFDSDVKSAFVTIGQTSDEVLELVREDMEELLEWIDPMLDLFRAATSSRPKKRDVRAVAEYDYASYGGRLTFHTFMATIDQTSQILST